MTSPAKGDGLAVEVDGLVKRVGAVTAVDGRSFGVRTGERFGFIGPDGAGKTTLFRVLVTLLLPDGGSARVLGHDVVRDLWTLRKVVGYMPDIFQRYGDMTVLHYIDYYGALVGLKGASRVKHVDEVLEIVEL